MMCGTGVGIAGLARFAVHGRGSPAAQRSPSGSLSRVYSYSLASKESALTAQFTAGDPLPRTAPSAGLLGPWPGAIRAQHNRARLIKSLSSGKSAEEAPGRQGQTSAASRGPSSGTGATTKHPRP